MLLEVVVAQEGTKLISGAWDSPARPLLFLYSNSSSFLIDADDTNYKNGNKI